MSRSVRQLVARAIVVVAAIVPSVALAGWHAAGAWNVSAYCPCVRCCGKSDGVTADGTHAPTYAGRLVSAPRSIPFGTRVWIQGVGECIVRDRGPAVRGKRLDLLFDSHDAAVNWGVQKRQVLIWVDERK